MASVMCLLADVDSVMAKTAPNGDAGPQASGDGSVKPFPASTKRLRILMISDFFYPNFGGVENHIYELSQCFLSRGHHVVVMTHAYGDRTGVRYVTNGLKVRSRSSTRVGPARDRNSSAVDPVALPLLHLPDPTCCVCRVHDTQRCQIATGWSRAGVLRAAAAVPPERHHAHALWRLAAAALHPHPGAHPSGALPACWAARMSEVMNTQAPVTCQGHYHPACSSGDISGNAGDYACGVVQVHGHQAFSVLANEAMLHARTMGCAVVFTDHSLFGFADAASICTNKVLKWTLSDVQAVVCVSHTSKENTVLRACLPSRRVFVIPNAVDTSKFEPFPRPEVQPDAITCAAAQLHALAATMLSHI
jgi:glycosyltransferase involved in cell wall biosynthesis